MAAPSPSLPSLLETLQYSLSSALELNPKLVGVEHVKGGISLLDVKNELLLAYLQNLVLLVLLKLRESKRCTGSGNDEQGANLVALVTQKLVEHRLYLEKGVRPLEHKLGYQIQKVLRAADEAEGHAKAAEKKAAKKGSNGRAARDSDSEANSHAADGDSDMSETRANAEDEDENNQLGMRARPSLAAMARPKNNADDDGAGAVKSTSGGAYRPPRLNPTVMPALASRREQRSKRRPLKSATMDEFVADELSAAPIAEPSVGTTIESGRWIKTARERKEAEDRREFEESNFVRLPKKSKKEKARQAKMQERSGRMNFGGEEWQELGEGLDRINRLTKGKSLVDGTQALLGKSRKRGHDRADGPSGRGATIGETFNKRVKSLHQS